MIFPDYPDNATAAQLKKVLSRTGDLAYDLINDGYICGIKIGKAFKISKVNVSNNIINEGDDKNAG